MSETSRARAVPMQTKLVKGLAVVVSLAAPGCGDSTSALEAPLSVVRDSVGITIVEYAMPAAGARLAWEIGAVPTVSIGTLEGEEAYQLFRVTDALRLEDGRILVVNRGSNELKVFDARGTHLASWGGEGEGPGEFTGISEVADWPGDSIMAFDFSQRRITVFDSNGVLGRTLLLESTEEITAPQFRAILPSGRLVVRAGAIFTAGEVPMGLTRADYMYASLSAEADDPVLLGAYPGTEAFVMVSPTSMSVNTHPFGRTTLVTTWGDRLIMSATDSYELRVVDSQGALTNIIRRDQDGASPTQADLDAYYVERFADSPLEQRTQQMAGVTDMPLVGTYPAFSKVMADPPGNLWVQEYQRPKDERVIWTVFGPDGRILGLVETPEKLNVFQIGEDYILGSTSDELEVEYVQMWPIAR